MDLTVDTVEALLNSLDFRYERENLALAGRPRLEVRLFNQVTGEQNARLEFEDGLLIKLDYWDKEHNTIRTVERGD